MCAIVVRSAISRTRRSAPKRLLASMCWRCQSRSLKRLLLSVPLRKFCNVNMLRTPNPTFPRSTQMVTMMMTVMTMMMMMIMMMRDFVLRWIELVKAMLLVVWNNSLTLNAPSSTVLCATARWRVWFSCGRPGGFTSMSHHRVLLLMHVLVHSLSICPALPRTTTTNRSRVLRCLLCPTLCRLLTRSPKCHLRH